METEISAELKEELRLIEKETKLLSQAPQSIRIFAVILWCVFAAVVIAVFLALKNGNYVSVLFFIVLGSFLVGTYHYQKKLFNLYTTACEIINLYKLKETSKTKLPFESNPPPESLMP